MPAADFDQPYLLCASDEAFSANAAASSDCDCDCACAPPPVALAAHALPQLAPERRYLADFATLPLDAHHVVAYNPRHGIAVLNQAAEQLAQLFRRPQSPATAAEEAPALWAAGEDVVARLLQLGLLRDPELPLAPIGDRPAALTAWLHVTDRCNLRCTYCYLPHLPLDMTPEVGRQAIDTTLRAALAQGFDTVKLKYAGGEALLKRALIAELHQYARAEAERLGLLLDGVVLSNGTLIDQAALAMLQALGLRLMISLDGLGNLHDQQRPMASGGSSFAAVARGVEQALAAGLTPELSITVSGASVVGLPDLLRWVLAQNLPFSLNFYREHAQSASHNELALEEQRMIAGLLAGYAVIEANLPRRSLLGALVDKASLAAPHAHPCSAGRGYLVFDHQGRVSECQMLINVGPAASTTPDTLWLTPQGSGKLRNLHVDEKEGCRDCTWKYWCAGGCPLSTARSSGRYDTRSPNCAIYKALFPAAVRLEGLRLLRYARAFPGLVES